MPPCCHFLCIYVAYEWKRFFLLPKKWLWLKAMPGEEWLRDACFSRHKSRVYEMRFCRREVVAVTAEHTDEFRITIFFHNKWWHHSYVNFTMSLEGNFATPINFDVAYKAAARARAIFYLCRASKLARNKVVKYCFQRHVLRHMAMCLGAPCEYNDFSFHLFPLSEGIFCNNCWTRDIVLTLIDFVDICITSDGSDLCQGLEWSP